MGFIYLLKVDLTKPPRHPPDTAGRGGGVTIEVSVSFFLLQTYPLILLKQCVSYHRPEQKIQYYSAIYCPQKNIILHEHAKANGIQHEKMSMQSIKITKSIILVIDDMLHLMEKLGE